MSPNTTRTRRDASRPEGEPTLTVCLVMNDFKAGGAERLVKDLAVRLEHHDGIDPVVIVACDRGDLKSEFLASDVDVVSLGVAITPSTLLKAASLLSTQLRTLDADVAHSHLSYSHLVSRIACERSSIPHVATYHNVRQKRPLVKRATERATRRLSDRIVCVSEGVRRSYGGGSDMVVIHNAIDVPRFSDRVARAELPERLSDVPLDDVIYLNVARCAPVKRQRDLIEAMTELESEDAHLVIVGDGPERPSLERTVAERGLSDRITITGYVETVDPYYAIADVFVSSSSQEGLPTTHIEALAAGLPVVSTEIPGVTEIIEHGKSGHLCPVDDPSALADGMRFFYSNDIAPFAEYGYRVAESDFSLHRMADRHVELYREVVRSHRRRTEEPATA